LFYNFATLACLWLKCSWTEVWAKNMTNGRIAVVLFNRAGVLYDFSTYRPQPSPPRFNCCLLTRIDFFLSLVNATHSPP
jgi:hypothetical protein